tara:strand:- start:405 stop:851 length:447 start_codon:yes stop_codon:yes gene_type:complete
MLTKLIGRDDNIKNPTWITIPWSIMHFWTGILSAMIFKYYNFPDKFNIILSFIIHSLYECNDYYKTHIAKEYPKDGSGGHSVENCIGDGIVNLIGTILYLKKYKQKPSGKTVIFSIIFTLIFGHIIIYYYGDNWQPIYRKQINQLFYS